MPTSPTAQRAPVLGYRATNEIMWAIELTILYDRYCRVLKVSHQQQLRDADWLKRHWVKTCIRLGSFDTLRIVWNQKEGRFAKFTFD
jgi:hypothetical protein